MIDLTMESGMVTSGVWSGVEEVTSGEEAHRSAFAPAAK